ncbi:MAG TPA: YggT family protein [Candidatus Desulfofervidus auxilii]|uniref:YggT family protein n=1 Tax=Desulfofervidus auxilii TaxID=1621989 RepID=A0A7C0U1Z1_DESA2|nr:YggT family protein [Candidatus Desulfofervidus auxilii]HDD43385.1 YggT family protein [Candidatus Desulfofervidus auxilii]
MFILANFLKALASVLDVVLTFYMWIIIIRALISWVNPDPYNPIVRFLYAVTEPVLSQIRRYLPVVFGGFDLSPLIAILGVLFLQKFLVSTLYQLALRLV